MNWVTKRDLKNKGLPTTWTALNRLINHQGFPPGKLVGRIRIWQEQSVDEWIMNRPSAKRPLQGGAKQLVEGTRYSLKRKEAPPDNVERPATVLQDRDEPENASVGNGSKSTDNLIKAAAQSLEPLRWGLRR